MLVFTFRTLNISCYSLLICKFSAEKWTDSLMGFSLYLISCFSLGFFKILSLIFAILNIECLGVNLFELVSFETSLCLCFLFETSWFCAFWTWIYVSCPTIGKFKPFVFFRFVFSLLFFFSFCNPTRQTLISLMLSQRSLIHFTLKKFFFLLFWLDGFRYFTF